MPPSIFYYYAGSCQKEVARWQPFELLNRICDQTISKRGHCNSKMAHSNLLFIEQFLVECCEAITLASQLIRVQGKYVQGMGNTCSFGLTSKYGRKFCVNHRNTQV